MVRDPSDRGRSRDVANAVPEIARPQGLVARKQRSFPCTANGICVRCVVCSENAFQRLIDPQPDRCIASDLRIVLSPLDKQQCNTCGAICRRTTGGVANLFEANYDLYAHEPGRIEEARRQAGYASWLASVISVPVSCFEAGSGNGSLLLALREHWPKTAMSGVEPAEGASAAARRAGLDVTTGYLQPQEGAAPRTELAIAINVIEHTADPLAFLRALASHADRVAIVCPDATLPNSEVLFGDHLHSLRPDHMAALFAAAGLQVERSEPAPKELGYFQIVVGRGTSALQTHAAWPSSDDAATYLAAWRSLDGALIERIEERDVAAFGAGEAAGLLRAYAPLAWSHVTRCAVDAPDFDRFGELPVVDARALEPSAILLAVRPSVQRALEAKLRSLGHRVVRWDDLIPR
jgi:hypothetical protein